MKSSLRIGSATRITGKLLLIDAAIMLLPAGVSVAYGESDWWTFAVAAGAAAVTGAAMAFFTRRCTAPIRAREGFVVTSFIWIVFGLFGIIPLMTGSTPLGFTDACFEIISGFTTTGASVIRDVEAMSHGVLFWRALSQWIGGLGIILFMLAVLPELNKGIGLQMFNAESTGITIEKLHPRIRQTAISLWTVYITLTLISILLLWAGPMDLFDSVCHTFAAIATGGFTTRNDGLAAWDSAYVYWVVTVVMFVAGLNFMVIFRACRGEIGRFLKNSVVRTYTAVILGAALIIAVALHSAGTEGFAGLVTYPLFHTISAITSTGFSVSGAECWGSTALSVTLMLMVCGACAGSTAGGMKVDRLMVLWQNLRNETLTTVFPKRVYVVRLYGSSLDNSLISRVAAFTLIYFLLLIASALIITTFGYTLTDSLFMSASCIGCNGLGYGATGADGGFGLLPDAVKWLLTADMLLGRLEIFTCIVLFIPSFWRR